MKRIKNKLFQIAAFLLSAVQSFSLISTQLFVKAETVEETQNETIASVEGKEIIEETEIAENAEQETVMDPIRTLEVVLNADKYTANEDIFLAFHTDEVVDYYYEASGVTVIEQGEDTMQFALTAEEEFGSIDVYADYGDGELVKSSVYTYKDGDFVYVSDLSKDQAWYNCMYEKYSEGLLTLEEWDDAYSDFSRRFVLRKDTNNTELMTTPASVAKTASTVTKVTGRLLWELADGTKLPLRQTKVELRDKMLIGSHEIATTYTDNNGNFTFSVDNERWEDLENDGLDIFTRCYTESYTFKVAQDWAILYNYADSDIKENVVAGTTTSFSDYYMVYDESINANKAVYVQQGMVLGQRFATMMGMNTDNFIRVVYPSETIVKADQAFCWGENENDCFSAIGKDNFNKFDVLIHEYGHFVECSMGNYGVTLEEIIENHPEHYWEKDNFEEKEEKEYAMELTWSESWASVFSQIAQETFSTQYVGVPDFADKKEQTLNGTLNFEYLSVKPESCEAQEEAVVATLWDLYDYNDAITKETHDDIALGNLSWWLCTTKAGTYTLQDFMQVIEEDYPYYRGKVGALLSEHQISPGYLTVLNFSSVSETVVPQLRWRVNGSQNNYNDIFQVVFYDNEGNYIAESAQFPNTQGYNTYFYSKSTTENRDMIPFSLWQSVLKDRGGTFTINIAVRGYNSRDGVSGPYISEYHPITLTIHKNLEFNSNNRYVESRLILEAGAYCDYTVFFQVSGAKVIQTFGGQDTIIELYSADMTLLASNDDNGYKFNALLKYNVSTGTEYIIRVKYFSGNGASKLAITSSVGALNSGVTDLTKYEDIFAITTYTGYSFGTYAQKNRTRLLTYTPPYSGSYNFWIESEYDTYMYVIDPRSDRILYNGVDYDDDSGEGLNPLITLNLEKDIPYLIVYSAYNPGLVDETENLTVKIGKN